MRFLCALAITLGTTILVTGRGGDAQPPVGHESAGARWMTQASARHRTSAGSTNQETYLGANVFTPGDVFAADYSNTPTDPDSAAIISALANLTQQVDGTINLEENVGEYTYGPEGYAINFNLATASTPLHKIGMYAAPSGLMPWARNFIAEPCCGDHHGLVVNLSEDAAWEAYGVTFPPLRIYGQGRHGTGAPGHYWNLAKPLTLQYASHEHTDGANAPDVPYIAGALLGDRDCCGVPINHALMIVGVLGSDAASDAYVRPAAGPVSNQGACDANCAATHAIYSDHFRLHSSFSLTCSSSCPEAQSIVAALKTYGAFLTDGAGEWSIIIGNSHTGAKPFQPWSPDDINNLSQIQLTDFDILDRNAMGGIICLNQSGC